MDGQHFDLKEGVYFQKGLPRNTEFERKYFPIREKERRIYSDEIVRRLPEIELSHPHCLEWKLRKNSLRKLLNYLNKRKINMVLDVGCGNGWMSGHLAECTSNVAAIDRNEVELKQAARVFANHKNIKFIYGDVLNNPFQQEKLFDLVFLSSSIQYFPDLSKLIRSLQNILSTEGEIHIIDSHLYITETRVNAQQRSATYFDSLGFAGLDNYYFHHCWSDLKPFPYQLLYDPRLFLNKFKRFFQKDRSPFPWIVIPAVSNGEK